MESQQKLCTHAPEESSMGRCSKVEDVNNLLSFCYKTWWSRMEPEISTLKDFPPLIISNDGVSDPIFTCIYCNQQWKSVNNLTTHINTAHQQLYKSRPVVVINRLTNEDLERANCSNSHILRMSPKQSSVATSSGSRVKHSSKKGKSSKRTKSPEKKHDLEKSKKGIQPVLKDNNQEVSMSSVHSSGATTSLTGSRAKCKLQKANATKRTTDTSKTLEKKPDLEGNKEIQPTLSDNSRETGKPSTSSTGTTTPSLTGSRVKRKTPKASSSKGKTCATTSPDKKQDLEGNNKEIHPALCDNRLEASVSPTSSSGTTTPSLTGSRMKRKTQKANDSKESSDRSTSSEKPQDLRVKEAQPTLADDSRDIGTSPTNSRDTTSASLAGSRVKSDSRKANNSKGTKESSTSIKKKLDHKGKNKEIQPSLSDNSEELGVSPTISSDTTTPSKGSHSKRNLRKGSDSKETAVPLSLEKKDNEEETSMKDIQSPLKDNDEESGVSPTNISDTTTPSKGSRVKRNLRKASESKETAVPLSLEKKEDKKETSPKNIQSPLRDNKEESVVSPTSSIGTTTPSKESRVKRTLQKASDSKETSWATSLEKKKGQEEISSKEIQPPLSGDNNSEENNSPCNSDTTTTSSTDTSAKRNLRSRANKKGTEDTSCASSDQEHHQEANGADKIPHLNGGEREDKESPCSSNATISSPAESVGKRNLRPKASRKDADDASSQQGELREAKSSEDIASTGGDWEEKESPCNRDATTSSPTESAVKRNLRPRASRKDADDASSQQGDLREAKSSEDISSITISGDPGVNNILECSSDATTPSFAGSGAKRNLRRRGSEKVPDVPSSTSSAPEPYKKEKCSESGLPNSNGEKPDVNNSPEFSSDATTPCSAGTDAKRNLRRRPSDKVPDVSSSPPKLQKEEEITGHVLPNSSGNNPDVNASPACSSDATTHSPTDSVAKRNLRARPNKKDAEDSPSTSSELEHRDANITEEIHPRLIGDNLGLSGLQEHSNDTTTANSNSRGVKRNLRRRDNKIDADDSSSMCLEIEHNQEKGAKATEDPIQQERRAKATEDPTHQEKGAKATEDPIHKEKGAKPTEDPIHQEKGAKATEDPNHQEKGAKATEDPNHQEEGANTTVDPNHQVKSIKTTAEPSHQEKEAKTTVEPNHQRKRAKTTVEPSHDEKGAKPAVESNHQRKRAKTTVEPSHEEKEAKTTVEPNHQEIGAKAAEDPNHQEEGAKTSVEPSHQVKSVNTIAEPSHQEKGAKTTVEPNHQRKRAKTTVEPSHVEKGAKTNVEPNHQEKGAKATENPNPQEEGAKTTVKPSHLVKSVKTTAEPSHQEKRAKTTVEPNHQRKRSKTTVKPSHEKKGAKTTVVPNHQEKGAKTTEELNHQEKGAKTTVEPNHREKRAKTTVEPNHREKGAKSTDEPNHQEKGAKTTVESNHQEKRAKTTVEPNHQRKRSKSSVKPSHEEKGAKTTVEPNHQEKGAKTTEEINHQEKGAKTTVEPNHQEKGAKTTVEPNHREKGAKSTDEPNHQEKGAKTTVESNHQEKRAKTTVEPNHQRKRSKTSVKPSHEEKGAKTTVEPNHQEKGAKTTEEINHQEKGAKTTVVPNHQEKGAKTTVVPNHQEKGEKTTEELNHQEKGAKTTVEPSHREKGAKTTVEPNHREKGAKTTVEPNHREKGAKTTAEPNHRERGGKSTDEPSHQEKGAKTTVEPNHQEKGTKTTEHPINNDDNPEVNNSSHSSDTTTASSINSDTKRTLRPRTSKKEAVGTSSSGSEPEKNRKADSAVETLPKSTGNNPELNSTLECSIDTTTGSSTGSVAKRNLRPRVIKKQDDVASSTGPEPEQHPEANSNEDILLHPNGVVPTHGSSTNTPSTSRSCIKRSSKRKTNTKESTGSTSTCNEGEMQQNASNQLTQCDFKGDSPEVNESSVSSSVANTPSSAGSSIKRSRRRIIKMNETTEPSTSHEEKMQQKEEVLTQPEHKGDDAEVNELAKDSSATNTQCDSGSSVKRSRWKITKNNEAAPPSTSQESQTQEDLRREHIKLALKAIPVVVLKRMDAEELRNANCCNLMMYSSSISSNGANTPSSSGTSNVSCTSSTIESSNRADTPSSATILSKCNLRNRNNKQETIEPTSTSPVPEQNSVEAIPQLTAAGANPVLNNYSLYRTAAAKTPSSTGTSSGSDTPSSTGSDCDAYTPSSSGSSSASNTPNYAGGDVTCNLRSHTNEKGKTEPTSSRHWLRSDNASEHPLQIADDSTESSKKIPECRSTKANSGGDKLKNNSKRRVGSKEMTIPVPSKRSCLRPSTADLVNLTCPEEKHLLEGTNTAETQPAIDGDNPSSSGSNPSNTEGIGINKKRTSHDKTSRQPSALPVDLSSEVNETKEVQPLLEDGSAKANQLSSCSSVTNLPNPAGSDITHTMETSDIAERTETLSEQEHHTGEDITDDAISTCIETNKTVVNIYQCSECNFSVSSRQELKIHIFTHHMYKKLNTRYKLKHSKKLVLEYVNRMKNESCLPSIHNLRHRKIDESGRDIKRKKMMNRIAKSSALSRRWMDCMQNELKENKESVVGSTFVCPCCRLTWESSDHLAHHMQRVRQQILSFPSVELEDIQIKKKNISLSSGVAVVSLKQLLYKDCGDLGYCTGPLNDSSFEKCFSSENKIYSWLKDVSKRRREYRCSECNFSVESRQMIKVHIFTTHVYKKLYEGHQTVRPASSGEEDFEPHLNDKMKAYYGATWKCELVQPTEEESSEEEEFECYYCGLTWDSLLPLKRHIRKSHKQLYMFLPTVMLKRLSEDEIRRREMLSSGDGKEQGYDNVQSVVETLSDERTAQTGYHLGSQPYARNAVRFPPPIHTYQTGNPVLYNNVGQGSFGKPEQSALTSLNSMFGRHGLRPQSFAPANAQYAHQNPPMNNFGYPTPGTSNFPVIQNAYYPTTNVNSNFNDPTRNFLNYNIGPSSSFTNVNQNSCDVGHPVPDVGYRVSYPDPNSYTSTYPSANCIPNNTSNFNNSYNNSQPIPDPSTCNLDYPLINNISCDLGYIGSANIHVANPGPTNMTINYSVGYPADITINCVAYPGSVNAPNVGQPEAVIKEEYPPNCFSEKTGMFTCYFCTESFETWKLLTTHVGLVHEPHNSTYREDLGMQ